MDKLNTSLTAQYQIFIGEPPLESGGWTWVDVRDIAKAMVLSIVSCSPKGCDTNVLIPNLFR